MNRLNELIERLSEASDDSEFNKMIARRVQQRREDRDKRRKELSKSIRVFLFDGNDIRLRKNKDIWTAENFNLDLSSQGSSIVSALRAIYGLSIRYADSLYEMGRSALAKEQRRHYDFIAAYGSVRKWKDLFHKALSAKLKDLAPSASLNADNSTSPKQIISHIESLCEKFKNIVVPPTPVFNMKTCDIAQLREFYSENFIPLNLAQVHVTILQNEQIILHFIGNVKLNGLDVSIYRLPDPAQERQSKLSVTRKIQGNDVRFALSVLGLTIYELDQVGFEVKIGGRTIRGRL